MENFLLPNIIELFETNRMSYFPTFLLIMQTDGIMKTRLATNFDGYLLRLALLFEQVYSDGADLF